MEAEAAAIEAEAHKSAADAVEQKRLVARAWTAHKSAEGQVRLIVQDRRVQSPGTNRNSKGTPNSKKSLEGTCAFNKESHSTLLIVEPCIHSTIRHHHHHRRRRHKPRAQAHTDTLSKHELGSTKSNFAC